MEPVAQTCRRLSLLALLRAALSCLGCLSQAFPLLQHARHFEQPHGEKQIVWLSGSLTLLHKPQSQSERHVTTSTAAQWLLSHDPCSNQGFTAAVLARLSFACNIPNVQSASRVRSSF